MGNSIDISTLQGNFVLQLIIEDMSGDYDNLSLNLIRDLVYDLEIGGNHFSGSEVVLNWFTYTNLELQLYLVDQYYQNAILLNDSCYIFTSFIVPQWSEGVYYLKFNITSDTSWEMIFEFKIYDPLNSFISKWNTSAISDGSSNANQIELPLESSGTYNFEVCWGDGSTDTITRWDQADVTHTYSSEGVFTVTIAGIIKGWNFYNGISSDKLKIHEISQWGSLNFGNTGSYFRECQNLILTATDAPDLTGTTTLASAFSFCTKLGNIGSMNTWNVSNVESISTMFWEATSFNQDIGDWDVSNVFTMMYTFRGASSFNQDIGRWNISNVIIIDGMFWAATSFNQDIGGWNVSSVSDMMYLFNEADSFNQPIGNWDVSSVTDMCGMFYFADSFNQPIGDWDVSSVTDMRSMFRNTPFNQPIGGWNVSSVTDMCGMFWAATSFNQDIGGWNVSSVSDMMYLFNEAESFNQDIGNWDVSSVSNMNYMFCHASSFNQPIGNWDVSSVDYMYYMFADASSFNQDLSLWNVSNVLAMNFMFYRIELSSEHYSSILIGWVQQDLQYGVNFHAGSSQYNLSAKTARDNLINTFGWTVTDGGQAPNIPSPPVLSSLNNTSTTGEIILDWGSVMYADSYAVYRSESEITILDGLTPLVSSLTGTIYFDSGLEDGIYYYVITASNADGESEPSNCENIIVDLPSPGDYFISVWNTSAIIDGSSNANQIELPLESSGVYNFEIDWGDGSTDTITRWDQADVTHTYGSEGIYTLRITGIIHGWNFCNGISSDRLKLIEISQWGSLNFGNNTLYFCGCENLNLTATDSPDLTGTTTLFGTFYYCMQLGDTGSMNNWDVSSVKDMYYMFGDADSFNQDIGNWNVSGVTDMSWMFFGADSFNKDISDWDVSNVIDMNRMFLSAFSFNQDIGDWDVSAVTDMCYMFASAFSFDQDISSWDISQVTNMEEMFNGVKLSSEYYTSMLINWAKLSLQNNISFNAGLSQYHIDAESARESILTDFSWTISDGGILPYIPSYPVLLSLNSPSTTGIVSLSWSVVENAESYSVYRSDSEIISIENLIPIASGLTNGTYIDSDLSNGTYYYAITAVNEVGESGPSNCENVLIAIEPIPSIPGSPEGLIAVAGEGFIALQWNPPSFTGWSSIETYYIYRSSSTNDSFVYYVSSPTNSYTDTAVIKGNSYFYKVAAVNGVGMGNFSLIVNISLQEDTTDDTSDDTTDDITDDTTDDTADPDKKGIPGFPTWVLNFLLIITNVGIGVRIKSKSCNFDLNK